MKMIIVESRPAPDAPWQFVTGGPAYPDLYLTVLAELKSLGFRGDQERILLAGELDPDGKPDPASDVMTEDAGAQIRVRVETGRPTVY